MIRIRVNEGTRSTKEPSLCRQCRYSQIIEGTKESEDLVNCGYNGRQIQMHVTNCTMFVAKNGLSIQEMENMAWFIELTPGKNYNLPTGETTAVRWIKPDERERTGTQLPPSYGGF